MSLFQLKYIYCDAEKDNSHVRYDSSFCKNSIVMNFYFQMKLQLEMRLGGTSKTVFKVSLMQKWWSSSEVGMPTIQRL